MITVHIMFPGRAVGPLSVTAGTTLSSIISDIKNDQKGVVTDDGFIFYDLNVTLVEARIKDGSVLYCP
jgi:hypothetical protein